MDRDAVFQALADKNRRAILDRLVTRNGQTLTALTGVLEISRQAVSKHLKVLEAAGLVTAERRGRERLHYLNPVPIHAEALPWLSRFEKTPIRSLAGLDRGTEPGHGR